YLAPLSPAFPAELRRRVLERRLPHGHVHRMHAPRRPAVRPWILNGDPEGFHLFRIGRMADDFSGPRQTTAAAEQLTRRRQERRRRPSLAHGVFALGMSKRAAGVTLD